MSSTNAQLGRVTHLLPTGGEHRPGQVEMANRVQATIASGESAFVEAGTGTGKSLAYLVPVVESGRRAIVATATIALQGQLCDSDIPLVGKGLNRTVKAAILKGRNNYVCLQRLDELTRAERSEQLQLLRGTNPGQLVGALAEWAEHTATGDREEIDPQPPADIWQAISVGADECPGANRCPAGDRCFSEAARQRAAEADVVITNHHYYGLDVQADGVLLGDHDVVVFDEAHHLPEVFAATCGLELSGGRLRAYARRLRGVSTDTELAVAIDRSATDLDNQLRPHRGQRLTVELDLIASVVTVRDRLDRSIAALRKISAPENSDAAARVERCLRSATNLIEVVDALIEADPDAGTEVTWVDGSDDHPILRSTPLDLTDLLTERLWQRRTVIATSATLPDALPHQLGAPDPDILRVGSPFDYQNLGLLYCPTHLPEPRHPDYRPALHAELEALVNAAGGRTLALFTSYRAMEEAAEYLAESVDLPLLVQGQASRAILTSRFRDDPRTVLLATQSFWQGIDLPGDTLTLVTIDRIPFPRPDDPVLEAKRRLVGANAFRMIDLPRAQILLAQAAGRLVRRADDHGVVAVLDTRLATNRSYRWDLIGALPPFKRTRHQDEVLRFLQNLDAESQ